MRTLTWLLPLFLAAAPSSLAGEIVFDLAPFAPGGVSGEVIGISNEKGLVIGGRIDATLVVNETSPWFLAVDFALSTGVDGLSSETYGWSGSGTFQVSFATDKFNGLLNASTKEAPFFWFLGWNGGKIEDLPGGGQALVPIDAVFTELRLTLTTAPCPFGDPAAPWTVLGGGIAGTAGIPSLAGTGSLCPNESGAIQWSGAAPAAPAVLVIGASELNLPILGGLLVPSPDVLVPPLLTNGAGALAIPFSWPPGLAPGQALWMQGWVLDAGAPAGLSATNGLRLAVP